MPGECDKEKKELTNEHKVDCTSKLKQLLEDQERLKNIPSNEAYLERYLYGAEFDVEVAFNRIKTFYNAMLDHPEWYTVTAPLEKRSIIEKTVRVVIPGCDKDGRPIYISKHENIDVRSMQLLDVVAVDDIWLESILSNNPPIAEKGLCVIVDIANTPLGMMKWMTPEYIKQSLRKLQSLPFKDFRFHVVNKSFLLQAILKILWPFLPEHIKQMVKFHFDDWDSLHKHIDPGVLPLEYRGTNNVNYKDIYNKLYGRNEEISTGLKSCRTVDKLN